MNFFHFRHTTEIAGAKYSWEVFHEHMKWYYNRLDNLSYTTTDMAKTDFGALAEIVPWDILKNSTQSDVKKVVLGLQKAASINKLLNAPFSENDACTLFLVWNKFYLHWIKIPCDEPLLDMAALYCMLSPKISLAANNTIPEEDFVKGKPVEENILATNVFQCYDKSYISSRFLCNAKKDCTHGEDEILCSTTILDTTLSHILALRYSFLNHTLNSTLLQRVIRSDLFLHYSVNLITNVDNHMTKVHTELGCFDQTVRCLYDIHDKMTNRTLRHCANGSHLDSCQNFSCADTYHCPGYYCVPWRYVCDEKWDCPFGYDEANCRMSLKPDFYHCSLSSINIQLHSICDTIQDCPNAEDEENCLLNETTCPVDCKCVVQNAFCVLQQHSIGDLKGYGHKILIVSKTDTCLLISSQTQYFSHMEKLILVNNVLHEFKIELPGNVSSLKALFAPKNQINVVASKSIQNFPQVVHVSFPENQIRTIVCQAFYGAQKIEVLLLAKNALSELYSCSFVDQKNLKYIDISGNKINSVSQDLSHHIFVCQSFLYARTTHKALCCLKQVLCTENTASIAICSNLIPNKAVSVMSWVISVIGVFVNVLSIVDLSRPNHDNKVGQCHSHFSRAADVANLAQCMQLIILAGANQYFGADYVFFQHKWHKSLPCHTTYFLSTWSLALNLEITMLAALASHQIVAHPLTSGFREASFVLRHISYSFCVSGIVCMTCTILHSYEDGVKYCVPYINNELASMIFTVFYFVLNVTSTIIVTILYILVLLELERSIPILPRLSLRRKKSTIIKGVFTITNHLLCTVPSAVIFGCFMVLQNYNIDLFLWTLVVLMPCGVLLNPILFYMKKH